MRKQWKTGTDFIFGGSKITADGDSSHEIKRLAPWKKCHDKSRQHIKKQRHYSADKGSSIQAFLSVIIQPDHVGNKGRE